MKNYIIIISNKIIEYSFYLLFFLTPLILTQVNYELFEFNKMIFTYLLAALVFVAWLTKISLEEKITFKKNPFTIPLLLFLASQIISTIFSMDHYTSLWGYYSRFNGGLVSLICYLILFFAFINNFPGYRIKTLLYVTVAGSILVSTYAVAQHFGIDASMWVQDVQNRVFSTLGQPNWLAAYLGVIIPLCLGLGLPLLISLPDKAPLLNQQKKDIIKSFSLIACSLLLYIALLFTKSRSGFFGIIAPLTIFWIIIFIKYHFLFWKQLAAIFSALVLFSIIIGIPVTIPVNFLDKLNFYQTPTLTYEKKTPAPPLSGGGSLDTGITGSDEIRKIVWKGAVEIIKHHPVIGTGVESFAYAYYLYRPAEHNLTSEWDFLYNKAHNEYLNIAATTGLFGLFTYLSFIITYLIWSFSKFGKLHNSHFFIHYSLLFGFISILITNFFGFSVVVIALLFFLIPALAFINSQTPPQDNSSLSSDVVKQNNETLTNQQITSLAILGVLLLILETKIITMWLADYFFSQGYNASKSEDYNSAYRDIKTAVGLNSSVPLYHSELGFTTGVLAVDSFSQKDSKSAASFLEEAIRENDLALAISPNNVNFQKTSTRLYYELMQIDDKYLSLAIASLKKAQELAPTDPKIPYNLAVFYGKLGENDQAIRLLQKTIQLKPNYKDAHYAIALFYEETGKIDMAKKHLELIVTKIDPNDQEIKKKLDELNKK